jgi:hypothetical protein
LTDTSLPKPPPKFALDASRIVLGDMLFVDIVPLPDVFEVGGEIGPMLVISNFAFLSVTLSLFIIKLLNFLSFFDYK